MRGADSIIGIIPARGGSKGVPGKNIRNVGGKPLIAWTIEAALASEYIDRVVLSSDDPEIIEVARQWGCDVPFIRSKELAADDTPGTAPLVHAIEQLPGYDYAVLLQPTSPLRTAEDIDRCIELCMDQAVSSAVSVTAADHHPAWSFTIEQNRLVPLFPADSFATRRQDLPPVYSLNGAVYVVAIREFLARGSILGDDTLAYVMPAERSADIDTILDLQFADFLLRTQ